MPDQITAAKCTCGHTAHWHGQEIGDPQGSGGCEFNAECGCKRFLLSEPLSPAEPGTWTLTFTPGFGWKVRGPVLDERGDTEVVEASRLREVEAQRDAEVDERVDAQQRADAAEHQLHQERERLRGRLNDLRLVVHDHYHGGYQELQEQVADAIDALDEASLGRDTALRRGEALVYLNNHGTYEDVRRMFERAIELVEEAR